MWTTRVTGFALVENAGALLMLRHERLGVTRWEIPGGHVDGAESVEEAAARETFEETGLAVEVGPLVATCLHEWPERHHRRLILTFAARPKDPLAPVVPQLADGISEVAWLDPTRLPRSQVSPLLHPLLDDWPGILAADGRPTPFLRAHHVLGADGNWQPAILPTP